MNKTININNKDVDNEYYKYIEQKNKYKQQILELYDNGNSLYKISKMTGLSIPSISLIIKNSNKN
jgi:transposase-like protein